MAEGSNPSIYEQAQEAANFLRSRIAAPLIQARIGIICGSGLGGLVESLHATSRQTVDYGEIPYFPRAKGMLSITQTTYSFIQKIDNVIVM